MARTGAGPFSSGSGGPVGPPGPRPAPLEATTPTDPPVQSWAVYGHSRFTHYLGNRGLSGGCRCREAVLSGAGPGFMGPENPVPRARLRKPFI